MSQNSSSKTVEAIKCVSAMLSKRIGSATVYYNGAPITSASGYGFDTQPFDDCVVALNIGTINGAVATLINQVYESATDDPSAATLLSGASFDSEGSSGGSAVRVASINCVDTKRYLFLRTESQGAPLTIDFSAQFIGGRPREQATDHTVVFDV